MLLEPMLGCGAARLHILLDFFALAQGDNYVRGHEEAHLGLAPSLLKRDTFNFFTYSEPSIDRFQINQSLYPALALTLPTMPRGVKRAQNGCFIYVGFDPANIKPDEVSTLDTIKTVAENMQIHHQNNTPPIRYYTGPNIVISSTSA